MSKNPHVGSSYEDFLGENGILQEVIEGAEKRASDVELAKANEQLRNQVS